MVIQCKNCGTRFELDDSIFGSKGRRVRCSQCKEVFFQSADNATKTDTGAAVEKVDDEKVDDEEVQEPESVSHQEERQEPDLESKLELEQEHSLEEINLDDESLRFSDHEEKEDSNKTESAESRDEQIDGQEEEKPEQTEQTKTTDVTRKKRWPWIVTLFFLLTLLGVIFLKSSDSGFMGWITEKRSEILMPFRLMNQHSEWRRYDFGPVLVVTGVLRNKTKLFQKVPMVQVTLLDAENQPVTLQRVVPGRVVKEEDLTVSDEKTFQSMIKLQTDLKRFKIPKISRNKEIEFQALFLDPPKTAVNLKVALHSLEEKASVKLKKKPTTKSFLMP